MEGELTTAAQAKGRLVMYKTAGRLNPALSLYTTHCKVGSCKCRKQSQIQVCSHLCAGVEPRRSGLGRFGWIGLGVVCRRLGSCADVNG